MGDQVFSEGGDGRGCVRGVESERPGSQGGRPTVEIILKTRDGVYDLQCGIRAFLNLVRRTDDGVVETPARVARAMIEACRGYHQDPREILSKLFDGPCDQIVAVSGIRFFSTCEHHLLPFYGEVSVAYLPDKHVAGISKLGRLVECFARRLQIQERMTREIADAIMGEPLSARGAAVIVEGHHLCMMARGVEKPESIMRTSAMLGVFRDSAPARAEAMALLGKRSH